MSWTASSMPNLGIAPRRARWDATCRRERTSPVSPRRRRRMLRHTAESVALVSRPNRASSMTSAADTGTVPCLPRHHAARNSTSWICWCEHAPPRLSRQWIVRRSPMTRDGRHRVSPALCKSFKKAPARGGRATSLGGGSFRRAARLDRTPEHCGGSRTSGTLNCDGS